MKSLTDLKKISVYGAGNYAKLYLPMLMQYYKIDFVMDRSEEKQGTEIYHIEIKAPNEETVNQNDILVLLDDFKSGYETLMRFGCKKQIYGIIGYAGGYGIFRHISADNVELTLQSIVNFQNDASDFGKIVIQENKRHYAEGKKRIFDIASPIDFDATGGPCACLRNLWLANEEYGEIDNFYTLCPSTCYVPAGAPVDKVDMKSFQNTFIAPEVFEDFPQSVEGDKKETIRSYLFLKSLWDFMDKAEERFHFTKDDIFLIQDPYALHVFVYRFPEYKNVVAAYHVQGALSSENRKKAPGLIKTYNAMQTKHLKLVKNWIFPSYGAAEGFLNTADDSMKNAAKEAVFHIAYNGYCPKDVLYADKDFVEELNQISADIIFASATFLYRNKGVERIPKILAMFKQRTGMKIHWILVGSGEMEEEVEKNLNQYLEESDYTWYRKRFENQDNIFTLFQKADFYIMMHYVSVFDLSTLQAMGYGCVPMLSNVGGNLELCGFENGILIDPDKDTFSLENSFENDVWNEKYLRGLQLLNKKIIKDKFNNHAFLLGYKKITDIYGEGKL